MVVDGIDIKVTNDRRSTKAAFIKAYSAKVTAEQEGRDGEMWTNDKKYTWVLRLGWGQVCDQSGPE